MAEYSFKAKARTQSGKSYAAKIRREGRAPGVVYGPAIKAHAVEFDIREMELLRRDTLGKNALIKMDVDGKQETVMFKDLLREPVKGKLLHVDFYHVDAAHALNLKVPVVLDGVAEGTKEGGILSHGVREIQVRCLPANIPAAIHVDINALKVEENILMNQITPPQGVTFLTDSHAVIAQISEVKEEAPTEAEEKATAEAEAIAGAAAKAGDAKAGDAKVGDVKAGEKKDEKK